MDSKSVEDMIEGLSGFHFSGFHMDGSKLNNIEKPTTTLAIENVHKQPFIIGVAGGAASGKTTVCDMIIQQLHDQRVVLVNQDSFYHKLTEEELATVHEYNFDHPDSFDTEKLLDSMENLRHGQAVDIPNYDFKSYKNSVFPARRKLSQPQNFLQVNPADVIILEGILIFHDPRVRELMNMKIFVDTDADVRLARRIRRDTVEKGRDIGVVLDQYSKFVKSAFDDFILPTKKYADIIIPRGGDNHVAIDLIVQHIRTKLGQHDLCKIYPNLYVIQSTFQIRGMHTLIRDSQTTKHDFVFYADRLIRLVVEHGLGHLPFTEKQGLYILVWISVRGYAVYQLLEVVRVWRMLCEHVAKGSRLARFLFIGKVRTTVSSLFMKNYHKTSQKGMCCYWILFSARAIQLSKLFHYLQERVYRNPTSYFSISYPHLRVYMWCAKASQE
ncbi:uridine kinase-like protein 4 isoform X4 [Gossypium raimondii]|uniref:uridine kinase-like protein 4 isoform X4 n=1 Tax=Gossypium raimondii TaxID=29730 RepID=UPI00227A3C1E|nr:uridine kinase-like protein 4 isoform X4 [Gossypium raimondii]